jgi:hypothetical protein
LNVPAVRCDRSPIRRDSMLIKWNNEPRWYCQTVVLLCIQGNVIPGTTHSASKRISADIMYKIQVSCVLQFRSMFLDILQDSGCFKLTLAFKQGGMGTESSHREAGNQNVNLKNHNLHSRHQFDCFVICTIKGYIRNINNVWFLLGKFQFYNSHNWPCTSYCTEKSPLHPTHLYQLSYLPRLHTHTSELTAKK